MAGGEKPRERWRIGTEHEKFVYRTADHRAPSYDEPGGIRDMLVSLGQFGWEPVLRAETSSPEGPDGNVSLEPAGQLELSGAPLEICTKPAPKPRAMSARSRPSARRPAPVSRPRPVARQDPRRTADHAQGPL
jgi:glutamate--cysteine ligase